MALSSGVVPLGLLALFLLSAPFASASWGPLDSLTCVPATTTVMERSEGRSRCAYDSRLGYRAIGVGYNLDDKSDERMREISTITQTDYGKLYCGEECLNDVQVNALLAFDARRYLLRAKERIENFNSFCCNVQSIFADVAFTHAKSRLGEQFSPSIDRALSSQYKEAAEELRRSEWCREHEKVCAADTRAMEEGCPTASMSSSRKAGSWLPANSLTCVPATTTVMERSEGRSRCAYDSRLGFRAIGVGYNLDDKSDERMREIATILADYEKLYRGEACLNDLQINTLLALDARRYLLRAGESVKTLDNFCCNVQAVFADVAFTHAKTRLGAQFDQTIQKASSFQWREAAEELRQSKWCRKNEAACKVDAQQLEEGCASVGDSAVLAFLDSLRGLMAA